MLTIAPWASALYDNVMNQALRTRPRLSSDQDQQLIDLSRMLNTEQVAVMFNRSQLTIQLWRKNKSLPYIRITGAKRDTIRYDEKALREWAQTTGHTLKD